MISPNKNHSSSNVVNKQSKICEYPSFKCDSNLKPITINPNAYVKPKFLPDPDRSKCLTVDKLCDQVYDCEDGSDESMRCNEKLCDAGAGAACSHFCQNSPDGHRCYCPKGMRLTTQSNRTACMEEATCDSWGTCSQLCKRIESKRFFSKQFFTYTSIL